MVNKNFDHDSNIIRLILSKNPITLIIFLKFKFFMQFSGPSSTKTALSLKYGCNGCVGCNGCSSKMTDTTTAVL